MSTPKSAILTTNNLTIGYRNGKNETTILSGLNLSLNCGELVCLLGANGIGKSTLLRTLSGVQQSLSGDVYINEQKLSYYSQRERSKLISIVYTDRTLAGALTVSELVSLGRHPYTGFFGHLDITDLKIIAHALEAVGMKDKANCYVGTLSDGERQKAMIARALAQEAPIIILDEPTAFLDVASRIETMNNLHRLAQKEDKAILLSSHDINQSLALANRLWLLRNDHSMIEGITEDLVFSGELNNLFADRDVAFDASIGDFTSNRSFQKQISLNCEDGLLKRWIINALQREGIGISNDMPNVITAISPCKIAINGALVNSISEMLDRVKSL
ncbi:MAG: ABC transporter ATP-binding protein [Muribaculaceae bacterium]|nr:ABC transporter ATP-binding protein [Muribaculaceae bacterium]